MQETWHRWEPASNLSKKYYINSITLGVGKDKFNIILIDPENKKISVAFPQGIEAYRYTNESFALLTIDFLDKTYGTDFYSKWTFFKIENSKYLNWISEQSHGIYDESSFPFMHFCILGIDSVINIVTNYEPTITPLD